MFYQIATAYSFHDTKIHDIIKSNDGVVLCFNEGIYALNTSEHNEKKTTPCKVRIVINDFDANNVFQHIEVKKQYKAIVTEIGFDSFLKMVKKEGFKVYLDYYCVISRSIKLEGVIKNNFISLTIFDIGNFDILHQT